MKDNAFNSLLQEQDLVIKELVKCHLYSPIKGVIKPDGSFEFIDNEPTKTELLLQDTLRIIDEKIIRYMGIPEHLNGI